MGQLRAIVRPPLDLFLYLYEDSKENDDEGRSDEHLAWLDGAGLEHFHQREADCSSQSSVSHDELFLQIDRPQPESIGDGGQQEYPWFRETTQIEEHAQL